MRQYKNILTILLGVFLPWLMGSCAALREQGGPRTYRELQVSLGSTTTRAIERRTSWVLERYAYILLKQEVSPTRVYLETLWQVRTPFADEAEAGASAAETRLIVRAGPLRGTSNSIMTNRPVWLVAENRVHMPGDSTGMPLANSDEFKAYIREIAAELKSEYLRDGMGLR